MIAIKSVKVNPIEIAKQNSAKLELQRQQEEQKKQPKTLKPSQSSSRLSSCGSINQESDTNKDLTNKMVSEVNNSDNATRKINLKRKSKTDS